MMMNIRGLAFDSLHTGRTVELSTLATLAFRRRAYTDKSDGTRDAGAEQVELHGHTDRVSDALAS